MSKGLLFATIVMFMGGLSGCTIFPKHEPLRVMDLTLQGTPSEATETLRYSLRVDTPYASEPFSGTRILVKPSVTEFRIYQGARWRDTAPIIIRDLLVQTIRESKGFTYVVSDTSAVQADWNLVNELIGFHVEYQQNAGVSVIRLHSSIQDSQSRNTLCAADFSASQPLEGTAINQVVESFNIAGEKLANSVSQWAASCAQPINQETDRAKPL